jgi:hypothetical protein
MHHTYDEVPSELPSLDGRFAPSAYISHALFASHVGKFDDSEHRVLAQHNVSQYRQRGYNVGSLMTEANEPDRYYKQPGHPLSPQADQGGRFDVRYLLILLLFFFSSQILLLLLLFLEIKKF